MGGARAASAVVLTLLAFVLGGCGVLDEPERAAPDVPATTAPELDAPPPTALTTGSAPAELESGTSCGVLTQAALGDVLGTEVRVTVPQQGTCQVVPTADQRLLVWISVRTLEVAGGDLAAVRSTYEDAGAVRDVDVGDGGFVTGVALEDRADAGGSVVLGGYVVDVSVQHEGATPDEAESEVVALLRLVDRSS